MKNLLRNLLLVVSAIAISSCDQDPDNTIYNVLDFESGAVLRTIEVGNSVLNSSDPNSTFSVTVQEQDREDGALMQEVQITATFQDLTSGNGTTTAGPVVVKTVPASDFTTDELGLPRATLTATFGEMTSAMGLSAADYDAGDVVIVGLNLVLTDGRVFGPSSAGSSITGGFYKSPFRYNALLTCSPEPGDYRVEMQDSYGDGWQTTTANGGPGITIDLGNGTILEVGMCSPYGGAAGSFLESGAGTGCTENDGSSATAIITIPDGAPSANWNFPGDNWGEISFQVYAPDDSLIFDSGAAGDLGAGLIPVTFCKL